MPSCRADSPAAVLQSAGNARCLTRPRTSARIAPRIERKGVALSRSLPIESDIAVFTEVNRTVSHRSITSHGVSAQFREIDRA